MNIQTYTNTVPSGYIKVDPTISLSPNRAMTMNPSGIVKINNNIYYDSSKKSYSDIEIFFSEEKKRYWISSMWQKAYTTQDIADIVKESKRKLTEKDAVGVLGLNPNDFTFTQYGMIDKLTQNDQKIFYTVKKFKKIWDCLDYVIVS